MRLANYSRMQSVLRRLSFGLGLSISLAAAATSHAAEAKFHSSILVKPQPSSSTD